jgi:hypothetical protein
MVKKTVAPSLKLFPRISTWVATSDFPISGKTEKTSSGSPVAVVGTDIGVGTVVNEGLARVDIGAQAMVEIARQHSNNVIIGDLCIYSKS